MKTPMAILLAFRKTKGDMVRSEEFSYQFLDFLLELLIVVCEFGHIEEPMRHADLGICYGRLVVSSDSK